MNALISDKGHKSISNLDVIPVDLFVLKELLLRH